MTDATPAPTLSSFPGGADPGPAGGGPEGGYSARLAAAQARRGHPVRIGLAGAGQMGRGFVAQARRVTGMDVVAVADLAPGRAEQALRATGADPVLTGDDPDRLAQAVAGGGHVAVTDARLLARLPVDVIVDATGVPDAGAELTLASLLAGKHVATLNVEMDVTVGHLLGDVAAAAGRVYTVCRGDEPAEAKRLVDFARDLAFEVVVAGKGKNNPLDPHATPDALTDQARARGMNPKMLCSFVDGSKTMIEMAALANATGLEVSRRGMYGPQATVEELVKLFRPAADGGILDRAGVVDYATGSVAPGVFVIARTSEPTVQAELAYLAMGEGPYYCFYRPYHLASIEAPLTVAAAFLDGTPSLVPAHHMAEVAAAAKRPLAPGTRLDMIGGQTVYGMVEAAPVAAAERLLPLGLAPGATVTRAVAADQLLTYDDVELDQDSVIVHLRGIQDRVGSGAAAARRPGLRSAGEEPPRRTN